MDRQNEDSWEAVTIPESSNRAAVRIVKPRRDEFEIIAAFFFSTLIVGASLSPIHQKKGWLPTDC